MITAQRCTQPIWFWRMVLVRGALAWAAARLAIMLLTWSNPALTFLASAWVVVLAGVLVQLHSRGMRERVFLANLGVGRWGVLVSFFPPAVLETAARLVAGTPAG